MTDETQTKNAGEKLRAKYDVKNSEEFVLKIARKYGLLRRYDNNYRSAELNPQYIPSQDEDTGLSPTDTRKNYALVNRLLWSRGITFGKYGEDEVSDLGNRLRILDGGQRAEEGWLSGYFEDKGRQTDKRCDDGVSAWHKSYASWILQRAKGFGRKGRMDLGCFFSKTPATRQEIISGAERKFKDRMNNAIANRFYEESIGTLGKIKPSERKKLNEIYVEVNEEENSQDTQGYMPKIISESQWESYKQARLNLNPTLFDRAYSIYHPVKEFLKNNNVK